MSQAQPVGSGSTGTGTMPLEPGGGGGGGGGGAPATRFRWVICGLLFFATTINYIDRAVLGVLAPELKHQIGWTDTQYGDINAAFALAYAIGFPLVGWFIDRVGTRIGYMVSLVVWSLAAAGHALARTPLSFGMARFALGLGESGNFPAAIKTTAEWFPRKERALATGIFNAGSNIGIIVAPAAVPYIAGWWGWQAAFISTGLVGLAWVAFWLPLYRRPERHPRVSKAELDHILSDPPEAMTKVTWLQLLPHRQTWAFATGKFLTDSIWWFYLFWTPLFLAERFALNIKQIGLPMVTIYVMADFGSIGGGWLSGALMKRGWSVNAARKTAMLACALSIVPVSMAPVVTSQWAAVLLIGVAASAHQGFSANMFTLASDMFPRRAVGSMVGIGGMAGAIGGILMQLATGRVKDYMGNLLPMFIVAACVYVLSVELVHLLAPTLKPVNLDDEPAAAGQTCPRCRRPVPKGAAFCPRCGMEA